MTDEPQDLQKMAERLDLALRAGGFGVWDWDLPAKRVIWDRRQCALYGFTAETFDGTTAAWLERIHPDDAGPVQAELARALSAREDFNFEFRINVPGAGERHIHSHAVFRRDSTGRVVRIVGIDRDVTAGHAQARELALLTRRLQLALKATGYGVWELDLATNRMIWDERMHELYGVSRAEFSGHLRDWQERVLPEDAGRDDERINESVAQRKSVYQSTFRIRRTDGTIRHLETLGMVERNAAGQAVRIVGLDRDVTEAAELREELRVAEERWQLALSGTNDGVWDWDLVTGRIFRDARYAGMLGYEPAELPTRQIWLDLGFADDVAVVESAIAEHLAGRTPVYRCEYRLRHKSGRWIWVLDRGKVVARDAAGRALRMVGTQTDITERKTLEEKLRHGEEMSLQLGRLAQIGAWEWNLETDQLTWSPEMFRSHEVGLGFEPTLELARSFYLPEARESFERAVEQVLHSGGSLDLELPFTTARGNARWARVLGRAELRDGRPVRLWGAFQDITAQREAELTQRKLERQLFQAQKMETLGTLAGGIAHDFNNLLTGIVGYQELAINSLSPGHPARNHLATARDASLRARDLVQQILAFSRHTESEKRVLHLAEVVQDACRFLRATVPRIIEIEVDTSASCGPVLADATQVHQVLLNLGSNAADAMRPDGGTMRLVLRVTELDATAAAAINPQLAPGTYTCIDFSDTGHGIDEETQRRIFDPFFTTKEVGHGTGLGLSVVHGIMQGNRGAVSVRSTTGQGATFTLYFPVAASAEDHAGPVPEPLRPGNGELIAVVDDEDVVRNFAQLALERMNYRVVAFDAPLQCLEVLRRNAGDYRVLLTDQTMPVMNGTELAEAVHAFAPQLPVVFMSGYFSSISPEMLARTGHVALLSKPFTNEELIRTIALALERVPGAGSSAV